MIGTPEANDGAKRMAAHSMLGGVKMSLATESARLCSDPLRAAGVKSEGGKSAKREAAAKMKERHYHVQNPCACDACLKQLDEPWKPGVDAEDQPRFASSVHCKFWSIFKQADGQPGLNDWKIITLEPKKESDPSEAEEAMAEVLAGVTERMSEAIRDSETKYGAFSTLDEDADGYYVVKWTSTPYTLQHDLELTEYTPDARADLGDQQTASWHE